MVAALQKLRNACCTTTIAPLPDGPFLGRGTEPVCVTKANLSRIGRSSPATAQGSDLSRHLNRRWHGRWRRHGQQPRILFTHWGQNLRPPSPPPRRHLSVTSALTAISNRSNGTSRTVKVNVPYNIYDVFLGWRWVVDVPASNGAITTIETRSYTCTPDAGYPDYKPGDPAHVARPPPHQEKELITIRG